MHRNFRAIQHKSPLYIWFLYFILFYRIPLSWKISLGKGWPLWKSTEVASPSFRPHGDYSVLLGRCRCSSASPGRWKHRVSEVPCLVCLGLLIQRVETLHHHHWLRLQTTNNFQVHSVELGENAVWVVDTAGACTTVIRGQTTLLQEHPLLKGTHTFFKLLICQSCCNGYTTAESDGFYNKSAHISTLARVFSLDTAERLGGEQERRVLKVGSPDEEDATHLLKSLKEKHVSNFRKDRNATWDERL